VSDRTDVSHLRGHPAPPADGAVQRWLARFGTLDQRVRATLSDTSADDDPDLVLARVEALLVRAERSIKEISTKIPRFAPYATRLQAAFDHLDAGDGRFLSDPGVESLHTIWCELCDDVRHTLG
jgi:hypothetical protein